MNELCFEVVNALNSTRDTDGLIRSICDSLSQVIDTTTFFIALYNSHKDHITFPYYRDRDNIELIENASSSGSITARVIKSGQPVFLSEQDLQRRYGGRQKTFGHISKVWLGVPIFAGENVIGVLAVQSYSDPACVSEKDIPLLQAISTAVAMALDRRHREIVVKESEEKYRQALTIGNSIMDSSGQTLRSDIVPIISRIDNDFRGNLRAFIDSKSRIRELAFLIEAALHQARNKAEKLSRELCSVFDGPIEDETSFRHSYEDKAFLFDARSPLWQDGTDGGGAASCRSGSGQGFAGSAETGLYPSSRVFHDIIMALGSKGGLVEMMDRVSVSLKTVLDAQIIMIALTDPQRNVIAVPYPGRDRVPDMTINGSKDRAVLSKALLSTRPVCFCGERLESLAATVAVGKHAGACIGLPIRFRGQVAGALMLLGGKGLAKGLGKNSSLLEAISDFMSTAIEIKHRERYLASTEKKYADLLLVKDKKRKEIGMALHEDLCPQLIGIQNLTGSLLKKTGSDARLNTGKMDKMQISLSLAVKTAKALSMRLCPPDLLTFGLESALKELCNRVKTYYQIDCRLNWDRTFPMGAHTKEQLFFIVQECVINAVKQGAPDMISITVDRHGGKTRIVVEDNAAGPPNRLLSSSVQEGYGKNGMNVALHRAEQINCSIRRTQKGTGGVVVVLMLNHCRNGK